MLPRLQTIEEAEQTTVYLAKNGGLDHVDAGMLRLLGVWIRAIANGGRRPLNVEEKVMWENLMRYYAKRLECYQVQFLEAYDKYVVNLRARAVTAIAQKFLELARPCHETDKEGKASVDWSQVVSSAYGLRYDTMLDSSHEKMVQDTALKIWPSEQEEKLGGSTKSATRKVWQCIVLLSRLRVAYGTFVESALHSETFR